MSTFEDQIVKNVIPELHNYSNFLDILCLEDNILNIREKVASYRNKLEGFCYVHPTATIHNSLIFPKVKIFEGCTVRNSIIFDNTIIGHCSEIANSIVLKNCIISRFSYLGYSFIGEGSVLSTVTLATQRYDLDGITLGKNSHFEKKLLSNRFGSIVGSSTEINAYTKLHPGAVIGKESLLCSYLEFSGYLKPGTKVYNKNGLQVYSEHKTLDKFKMRLSEHVNMSIPTTLVKKKTKEIS